MLSVTRLSQQRLALGFPSQKAVSEGRYGEATYIEIGNQNEGSVSVLLQPGWEQGDDLIRAVRSDGDKVILVPRDAFSLIANDADWFRDHRMLPPVRERARSVRLEQDGEVILEIQRGPSGLWSFAAPERLAGKPVENERLFGRSALTEFLAVIDSVALTGFTAVPATEPTRRLVVGWDFGGQARLDRVDIHPATSAGSLPATTTERPSEGLALGPELLEVFDPLWADRLRELSPLSIDLDTVARFEVVSPDGTTPLVIERDAKGTWIGDDEWGRRYGLAVDLPRSFRGFSWAAERDTPSATFVEFVYSDADGVIVERIRLREPGADEEGEAYGKPVVLARLDSEPGLELAVPRLWWDAALALQARPQRTDKL